VVRKLFIILLVFQIVPILVHGVAPRLQRAIGPEYIYETLRMDLGDFLDLIVAAPAYAVILYELRRILVGPLREPARTHLLFASFFLICGVLYGHAMHLGPNSINIYTTEIHDYRNLFPQKVYSMICFFDEDLSHWVSYGALYLLMALFIYAQHMSVMVKLTPLLLGMFLSLGIISGAIQAVGIVMAGFGPGVYGFGMLEVAWCLGLARRSREATSEYFSRRPASLFILSSSSTILVTAMILNLVGPRSI